jgi:hypothetical protein
VHFVHEQVLRFIAGESDDSFDSLALTVFQHQWEHNAPYRSFCEARSRNPSVVKKWRDIPPVPIHAFKVAELCCAPPERIFLSTGTTAGIDRRSRHLMPDVRLYHASAVAGLRRFLFPDVDRMQLISLVLPADLQPESSLAQMVAWAMEEFGHETSAYAVSSNGIWGETCTELLRNAEASGEPACLLTTTGALIRFLDFARERALTFRLPHGSRLMDTGGGKGAPRPMSRNGLLQACWNTFAIPGYFCVNEYGMAELSSQFYDNVIENRVAGRHRPRFKVGPHWARTIVLDPGTLEPLPPDTTGLLCHFDLANAGTVMAVLTEDLGKAVGDGFELLGRVPGAEVRGCSLSIAQWQAAQGDSVPAAR